MFGEGTFFIPGSPVEMQRVAMQVAKSQQN